MRGTSGAPATRPGRAAARTDRRTIRGRTVRQLCATSLVPLYVGCGAGRSGRRYRPAARLSRYAVMVACRASRSGDYTDRRRVGSAVVIRASGMMIEREPFEGLRVVPYGGSRRGGPLYAVR